MVAAETSQSTSSTTSCSFSGYFYKLEPNVKARYIEKISLCDEAKIANRAKENSVFVTNIYICGDFTSTRDCDVRLSGWN